MSIFKPIEAPTHLKGGIFGFAGSGKTFTAMLIALGLHKYIKSDKPIYGIESETGLSYVKDNFEKQGVKLLVARTRAFVSLVEGLREIAKEDNIIIIDSITHYWNEIVSAYLQKVGRKRLLLKDFGPLKQEWAPFPNAYLNSKAHIIMCGRAGYTWGEAADEDGENKTVMTGTKMKVEGDLGYEPTLLIEMEQVKSNNKIGSEYINRAWILKDKFDVIKGKCFEMPTFESFLPHVARLNIGGIPTDIDMETTSTDSIVSDRSIHERLKQRDILVEEFYAEMPLHFNGRTDVGKSEGVTFLKTAFGSASKIAIENLPNEKIMAGLAMLRDLPLLTMEVNEEKKGKK